CLSSTQLQTVTRPKQYPPVGATIAAQDVYRVYFHGPAYQVVQQAWWDGTRMIGLLAGNLPGNHHPPDLRTVMSPRLIELCFQSAGLWELAVQGQLGLPQRVEEIRVLRSPETAARPLYAVVTPQPSQFDVEVIDTDGTVYVQLKGYRTVALPGGVDANALKALQALTSLQTAA
ncbi:MAG TPA: polyketide synthase dehydratase domain-containing protein, partial [Terriglobales bacterium]|nr:polyketide synthase dehydratase domain-containing protein [Terriglobales bacterium]